MCRTSHAAVLSLGLFLIAWSDNPGNSFAAPKLSAVGGYKGRLVGNWESSDGEKLGAITVEFKPDGGLRITMGPFELTGTYKVVKEDGKVLTVDSELTFDGFGELKTGGKDKTDKKTFTITFEDDDTITMNPTDKPGPKKLKRKK